MDTDCWSLHMDTGASRGFSVSIFALFQLALKQIYCTTTASSILSCAFAPRVFQTSGLSLVLIFCTTGPPPPGPRVVPSGPAHTAQASAPPAVGWELGSSQRSSCCQAQFEQVLPWGDACRAGRGTGAAWWSG